LPVVSYQLLVVLPLTTDKTLSSCEWSFIRCDAGVDACRGSPVYKGLLFRIQYFLSDWISL